MSVSSCMKEWRFITMRIKKKEKKREFPRKAVHFHSAGTEEETKYTFSRTCTS